MAIIHGSNSLQLVCIYQWILDKIKPEYFKIVFMNFVNGALDLIDEVKNFEKQFKGFNKIHHGRPE
ncbi:MAG: hypothetical protein OEY49_13315 [Candidatus Heimdallarchaeota archaeon]|nr:hypothetical protein [Candidatus Heimdallarchaeota archaeon]